MTTQIKAPDFPAKPNQTRGYPSGSRRLGPAWNEMWAAISTATDAVEGNTLAAEVAPKYGLAPATLIGLLSRAASAGLLQSESRQVVGSRGHRPRAFYRIKDAA